MCALGPAPESAHTTTANTLARPGPGPLTVQVPGSRPSHHSPPPHTAGRQCAAGLDRPGRGGPLPPRQRTKHPTPLVVRKQSRGGDVGARVAPARLPSGSDKSLDRGLTFNRSQRVSCSATYETLTQNQVVYK